jgi:hypothetical protein
MSINLYRARKTTENNRRDFKHTGITLKDSIRKYIIHSQWKKNTCTLDANG